MNSYSENQSQDIDIFATHEIDIFDTSGAQTVDIFDNSTPATPVEVDIFATENAEVDIFAADTPEINIFDGAEAEQQIDIFATGQDEPVSIWSTEVNSQATGNSTDPLNVKFDTLLQALNGESLVGIAVVVQAAKNLYNNGISR